MINQSAGAGSISDNLALPKRSGFKIKNADTARQVLDFGIRYHPEAPKNRDQFSNLSAVVARVLKNNAHRASRAPVRDEETLNRNKFFFKGRLIPTEVQNILG
jgi:hypothetical protein